ncbi:MAG: hypothetical protein ACOVO1_11895 [Chitinophagaceae bacterium]
MKNRILKCLLTIALFLTMQQDSFAGFPIGNGRWLLVPTYTRYTADSYWNATGSTVPYPNNGRFQSNYFGLFGGVGIGRDLDFLFNLPYVSQRFTENGVDAQSPLQTTGDMTLGLSYFLNHYDYYKHLSVTGSLIIPTYPSSLATQTDLIPGYASVGLEGKIGLAGTNTKSLKDTYYDVEAGLRTFFNAGGPTQFFANATFGVPINEGDWKVSGTLNFISSSSSAANSPIPLLINKDFSYLRGSLALGKRLDRNLSLWGSIFRDFTGTSIGQGQGFSVFLVIKF